MRPNVLGVPVDPLNKQQWLDKAVSLMKSGDFHYAITVNALLVLDVLNDSFLKEICEEASLLVPDSSGYVWANSTLNNERLDRYAGIDFALDLCKEAAEHNIPVFLLGGKPGISEKAKAYLEKEIPYLKVAGVQHGYYSADEERVLLKRISQSAQPNSHILLLVALGMPRQEFWINKNRQQLPAGLAVGVGGTFDVWAGVVKRAPAFLRRSGFEWLYRFIQEPFRWKRILLLPYFAYLVIKEKYSR